MVCITEAAGMVGGTLQRYHFVKYKNDTYCKNRLLQFYTNA